MIGRGGLQLHVGGMSDIRCILKMLSSVEVNVSVSEQKNLHTVLTRIKHSAQNEGSLLCPKPIRFYIL